MPYTAKQRRLFAAAAHDAKIASKHGMTKKQAKKLLKHKGTKAARTLSK